MQAALLWKKLFSEDHLREQYENQVKYHPSVGMDKVTIKKFESKLDEEIEIILRKTADDTYHFTRYKLLLFTKGLGKYPRPICVPTMRDKLTLSVLNELLFGVFGNAVRTPMPQPLIQKILEYRDQFDSYIRLDISQFYPSICQEKLLKLIRRKIHKNEILNLIEKAIKTEAIQYPAIKRRTSEYKEKGIPEGLSISNALANIYMMDVDKKYSNRENVLYCRYIDDILVLLQKEDQDSISKELEKDIQSLKLPINCDKQDSGFLDGGVEYLGYKIYAEKITVRESSVLKLEQSIEDLFREVKRVNRSQDKTNKYIEWKLNIKITGFIMNEKKYGWVFFYSQITDISLLFHLDDVVSKLLDRYGLKGKITAKRFVKTYFEISKALHTTKYIPNIDKYSLEKKKECVEMVYGTYSENQSEEVVEWKFQNLMRKEIRNIERDIQSFS